MRSLRIQWRKSKVRQKQEMGEKRGIRRHRRPNGLESPSEPVLSVAHTELQRTIIY